MSTRRIASPDFGVILNAVNSDPPSTVRVYLHDEHKPGFAEIFDAEFRRVSLPEGDTAIVVHPTRDYDGAKSLLNDGYLVRPNEIIF